VEIIVNGWITRAEIPPNAKDGSSSKARCRRIIVRQVYDGEGIVKAALEHNCMAMNSRRWKDGYLQKGLVTIVLYSISYLDGLYI